MVHKFPIEKRSELDSPGRKRLFGPVKALKALGIGKRMVVADIGCGTGFLAVALARLVGPAGRVLAVDISREMLADARIRIKKEKLRNVELILSRENRIPVRPRSVDYCLLVSVVHELENKTLFLRELKRLLKKDGKVGVIEWKKIPSRQGPPLQERISIAATRRMFIKNGFAVKKTFGLGAHNYAVTATVQGAAND